MSKKLAIIGYGKMGRMVEQLAPEFGFSVLACIDPAAAGATRDFLEDGIHLGFSEDPHSPDNRRIRELMLLYPR